MKINNLENNNMLVSLLSPKIKVIILGGGHAAYIKSKTFSKKGCQVYILSKKFMDDFENIAGLPNVDIINAEYEKKYIEDKHLVVIATDDVKVNYSIAEDCRKLCKIYIDATKPENGNCITPCQRNTKNISIGINTKGVSPVTSVFIANKLVDYIKDYDEFVEFTSHIRNSICSINDKKKIMKFICTDDFYFFYKKGKALDVINMFFTTANLRITQDGDNI
ncbi:NAD(P)-dependent oxidoreductase [Clostridium autoethanogenum]|uniref:precorrin-2 dehydrogenase n=1 Tax=Clostridium autoethanogenum DSM 10061 TaxID=1341692 RepID=A0ABN4BCZ4_9CLOT|nr:NAD(P)-dependent oxidoreductase [Clostridium autoethanogenum]AGY75352.1 NAD(P)-dependent oxidoreductase [Clostridium autoethanogenum DSM 10061]ALU35517.1 Precorrin-2 dehydrogenase [Clostridium autoethanogenum DSM 10061]OVY52421.1 Siroheme synthase [Clostridium autoethanogenum]